MTRFDLRPNLPSAPVHPVLWLIAGLIVATHLLAMSMRAGLIGTATQAWTFTFNFGFVNAYFDAFLAGDPVPLTFWISFISHAFLHGSWLHLGMNTAVMLALGHAITRMAGIRVFLAIFFPGVIAGAIAFALLTSHEAVLIGASGGVFALLGAVIAWRGIALYRIGASLAPVLRLVGGLAVIEFILSFGIADGMAGGVLSWQAHLGGFLAGVLIACLIVPRAPRVHREVQARDLEDEA